MHILFLTHYFPPEVNAPASRTYEHCRRWVQAGHQVTVVTCAPNCPSGVIFPGYRNRWRSEEWLDGIRVVRVWTWLAANQGFGLRLANYLSYMLRATLYAATSERPDLIVATSPQFFCGWAGVLAARLRRVPLVLEIRDLWPESIVAVGAMKPSRWIKLLEWLERRMYAAAERIVTVGSDYRAGLLAKGVPAEKIDVVPNGVDLAAFRLPAVKSSVRSQFQAEGRFVCAYIGTVGMAHGLEVVLDAAESARRRGRHDLAFWIVGDGARRAELQEEARRRDLANVVFTGLLPKGRMPEVIAACDACLVHLRPSELFQAVMPSKIFEIMAMDVPIVMGVRGGAQEIVLEARAGVAMTPGSHESLLACIDEIRARGRHAFRGRQYVARHFNRSDLAMRMLGVLSSCADQPRARAA
jgi:glycosyltransferase involved in cell wall biosynthesis